MYEIIITDKVKKQLEKLPSQIKNRIGSAFERIKFRPFSFIKRKQGTPYYILRIGNYRAILNIQQNNLIIFVIEIGPRKNIYNP